LIILCCILAPNTLLGQCQSPIDATTGPDRNNFIGFHSEGYMHNFDLPANLNNCMEITAITIDISIFNIDDDGMDPSCLVLDYYLNFYNNCTTFGESSCSGNKFHTIISNPLVDLSYNVPIPPNQFELGDVIGVDIIPAMGNSACPNAATIISSGDLVIDYEICVTITTGSSTMEFPVDLGNDIDACQSSSETLDAGSHDMYMWTTSETSQMIDVGPGTYGVTVTDAAGCTSEDEVTIIPLPDPTITFDPATPSVCEPNAGNDNFLPVCNDGTLYDMAAQLGTHDPGGVWQDTDFSGLDINLSPNAIDFTGIGADTYRYTYVAPGTSPCSDDEAVITVTVSQSGNAGTSDVFDLCADVGSVDYMALLSGPDTGGSWADLDGSTVDLSDPFNVDISGLSPDSYRFQYTIFANGACLTLYINGQTGGNFADTDASGALSGSIFNSTGFAGQSFDFTYTVGSAGSGCGQGTAIITINVESGVSAGTASVDSLCIGESIDLFDLLTNEDTGGTWSDLDGSGGLTDNILNASSIAAGTYTYKYLVGDDALCPKDSASVEVNVKPEPSVTYSSNNISLCQDQCTEIEFSFSGASLYQLLFDISEVDSLAPIFSGEISANEQTYTLTACQISNAHWYRL